MKPERLSPKALCLMANMHGMSAPVTSADLAFLAPATSGAREWASSTLRRLADMGLLASGPRRDNAQSFELTDAGRSALFDQAERPILSPEEDDILYWYDGPVLFMAEIFGATRLVMSEDLKGTYIFGTPSAEVFDAILDNRVKINAGMIPEPCLRLTACEDGAHRIGEDPIGSDFMRTYCGKSGYLRLDLEDEDEAEAEAEVAP